MKGMGTEIIPKLSEKWDSGNERGRDDVTHCPQTLEQESPLEVRSILRDPV
jgi:hypothetical protein